MVTKSCWLLRCNPALMCALRVNRCASVCKAKPVGPSGRRSRHIEAPRMNRIKSLLFRRRDMDGIDVYFAPGRATIKSLLFQLVPTRYRAQRYNRQLRREIAQNPKSALLFWPRANSTHLYYLFHPLASALV